MIDIAFHWQYYKDFIALENTALYEKLNSVTGSMIFQNWRPFCLEIWPTKTSSQFLHKRISTSLVGQLGIRLLRGSGFRIGIVLLNI